MVGKVVEKAYSVFRYEGGTVVAIEEADQIATDDVGKEWGDTPWVQLEAWVKNFKIISGGSDERPSLMNLRHCRSAGYLASAL